jgi:hypothetical protein
MAAGLSAGQPTPVSVSPSSQTINNTVTTQYTFVASDSDGASDLPGIDALFETVEDHWVCKARDLYGAIRPDR